MKTADLIADLAAAAACVKPVSPRGRIAVTLAGGGVLALAMLLPWLGLRPLGTAVRLPSFWMKGVYTALLAVAAWTLAARLSRPAGRVSGPVIAIAAILLLMMSMGAMELTRIPAADRVKVWLGGSWKECSFNILALSIPFLMLGAIVVRRLAPTRLVATGAALGLMAGAAAATVYGLHCDERSAAFTATWYTLGIGLAGGAGALLGPRVLRW